MAGSGYSLLMLSCLFLDEAQSDKAKESIRAKCVTYLDRADTLKRFIDKKKLKQPANTEENT